MNRDKLNKFLEIINPENTVAIDHLTTIQDFWFEDVDGPLDIWLTESSELLGTSLKANDFLTDILEKIDLVDDNIS